jgi:pimeloyl-ACP methyl ester carboxylesterase
MGKLIRALLVLVAVLAAAGVGGYFALKRGDIPYVDLAKKYGNEQSKWLDLGEGVRVHYRDQGNPAARTVVMVHGFSASLHTWEPWVKELGGAYRIVSLDLPGHGLTETPKGYQATMEGYADLVDAAAAKLGLERFVIVGSSMGGNVAWQTALRHPERVDGLVLVGAAGWRDPRADPSQRPFVFKVLADPFWGPMIRDLDSTAMTRQGLRAAFAGNEEMVDEAMVARYTDMSRAPNHRDLILSLSLDVAGRTAASDELMAQIKVPTLVMHGKLDKLVPFSGGENFARTITGAKTAFYDDLGHVPMEQAPARTAADLKAFLDALPPSQPVGLLVPPASAEKPKPLTGVY